MNDLVIVLKDTGYHVRTGNGTRVFHKGEELEEVTSVEILPINSDGIVSVKLTIGSVSIVDETTDRKYNSRFKWLIEPIKGLQRVLGF